MNLSPENKIGGVLVPLFALRGEDDLGIGDTAALREFIKWAADIGFRVVQLLPINETGGDNSPYNAISSRAIEPSTLHLAPGSPAELSREDFEATLGGVDLKELCRGPVKYARVKKIKRALLEAAYGTFCSTADAERRAKFQQFCREETQWLNGYTLFRALMEENGGSEAWDGWAPEHRSIEDARVWLGHLSAEKAEAFEEQRDFFRYVQWIAREQWRAVRAEANGRGVALMGDIPFGVSLYSADVFSRPNDFATEWCGGAPPEPYFKDDEFTMKWGQNWGIPVYNWLAMRGNNLEWWRQRIAGVRDIFDVFRIDHVLGFYRIYAFPWRPARNPEFLPLDWNEMLEKTGGRAPHFTPRDDSSRENAQANREEGEEYLRTVLAECRETRLVGEDLGTVPDYVRPSLHSLGIAGFKIPQWETWEGRVIPGTDYHRLSVATYATHDHKPVLATWQESREENGAAVEQARFDLYKIAQFAGASLPESTEEYHGQFYPTIMRALFASNAWMAIVMITDLLGRVYRFNVPGIADDSNWSRRLNRTVTQLRRSRTERRRMQVIRQALEESGRVTGRPAPTRGRDDNETKRS